MSQEEALYSHSEEGEVFYFREASAAMVNYRRMANMEMHLGNTKQTTIALINTIWKSPRWTVYYIRALAVVAVISTFLCIGFGFCRRSSNRWIVHKGFFVAAALSVSLGTYSIGLMQSSRVKSEMYPVWTVSLFALYNCIDPVTAYNGFDYKGPLVKAVFGICLNCGYVLLMIVSANSSYTGNTAIIFLSVITFIKGFHRSLALVQQSRMRDMIQNNITDKYPVEFVLPDWDDSEDVIVDFATGTGSRDFVTMKDIASALYYKDDEQANEELRSMCFAFSLSHKLQRHFLVLGKHALDDGNYRRFVEFKKALEVIGIELAFLYEIFFTGNAFHHYYQAKATSFWSLASFIGICSVGIAVAVAAGTPTPGATTMTSHHHGGSTNVVDTTVADLVITFGILVSLVLLQLMHLIQCWTSNWARLAVACAYAMEMKKEQDGDDYQTPYWRKYLLRLKLSVATSTNLFDKDLWQNKLGQYSELPKGKLAGKKKGEQSCKIKYPKSESLLGTWSKIIPDGVKGTLEEFGLGYVKVVLRDLLGRGINKVGGVVSLDEDVKDCIDVFIGDANISNILENKWLSNSYYHPLIRLHLPYFHGPGLVAGESHGYRYTRCVMMWHVATWYCEQLEQEREKKKKQQQQQDQDGLSNAEEGRTGCWGTAAREQPLANKPEDPKSGSESDTESKRPTRDQNRRVANALSKYCAYLVVSAPELLPGPALEATSAYKEFASRVKVDLEDSDGYTWDCEVWTKVDIHNISESDVGLRRGVALAKLLLGDYPGILSVDDPWKELAGFWIRMLVYAAPYGDMEAHRQRLTQGGEFITHLWAMLYHLNVREWKLPKSVRDMNTIDEANSIRTAGNRAVVAFFRQHDVLQGYHYEQFAAASRLVDCVIYYQTTNLDLRRVFEIPAEKGCPALIFLNQNLKPTIILYDGDFNAYDIACFVWNKWREDREATTEMINSNSREAANSPSSSD